MIAKDLAIEFMRILPDNCRANFFGGFQLFWWNHKEMHARGDITETKY